MILTYDLVSIDETDDECRCSTKHVPLPMVWARVVTKIGVVTLCPTGVMNLRALLEQYNLTQGKPSGSVTKHYGKFIRDLAAEIYKETHGDD